MSNPVSRETKVNQPHTIQAAKANAERFDLDFDRFILADYVNEDGDAATRAFHTSRSEERAEFWRFISWARRNKRVVRIIPATLLNESITG